MKSFLIAFLFTATTLLQGGAADPKESSPEPSPTSETVSGCWTGRVADGEHGGLYAELQLADGSMIYIAISGVEDFDWPKCSDVPVAAK